MVNIISALIQQDEKLCWKLNESFIQKKLSRAQKWLGPIHTSRGLTWETLYFFNMHQCSFSCEK